MKKLGIYLTAIALVASCGGEPEAPLETPQPMSDQAPFVYPLDLWDHNIAGQTVLLMRISEFGAVDSVAVAITSGYPEFDSAAVQGARLMKFTPGKQGDRRVAMWTKLPVRFTRDTLKMGLGGE